MRTEPEDSQSSHATFVLDVLAIEDRTIVEAAIEHRHRGDPTWCTLGTFSGVIGDCVATLDLTGIRDQYRWEYDLLVGSAQIRRDVMWHPDA